MTAAVTAGFDDNDEAQLTAAGIPTEEAARQLQLLREPPPAVHLDRPCTVGDGILSLETLADLPRLEFWQAAAASGRLSKFVPASGAATRMFEAAQRLGQSGAVSRADLDARRQQGDVSAAESLELIDHAAELPFARALAETAPLAGIDLTALVTAEQVARFLDALLTPAGLALPSLAKGLIPFHLSETGARTAFEEHLAEGVDLLADRQGVCRLHFTVPAPQRAAFEALADRFAAARQTGLQVELSHQEPATDTLAVTDDGEIARRSDGRLLLRPGGHGALLSNLAQAGGDIVVIKNIDNVTPESRHAELALWHKRMLELLLQTERQSHRLQKALEADDWENALEAAAAFCRERLHWSPRAASPEAQRTRMLGRLDRPLRVCGMVPSAGEPGGGPFWVVGANGERSLQIVESAQIDTSDPSQSATWRTSTHFNPVILAASVRDRHRQPYRLSEWVDPSAVFVTEKPIAGRRTRVLERPGLWNGAMARWNTLFVELPPVTFAPVKTVLDLLRPAHRASVG